MCIYIYIYIYIYIRIYIHGYIHTYIFIYIYMYMYVFINMYIYISVYIFIYIYVCVYAYSCVLSVCCQELCEFWRLQHRQQSQHWPRELWLKHSRLILLLLLKVHLFTFLCERICVRLLCACNVSMKKLMRYTPWLATKPNVWFEMCVQTGKAMNLLVQCGQTPGSRCGAYCLSSLSP